MAADSWSSDLSELEQEFELEMEDAMDTSSELDEEIDDEFEREADAGDSESEWEFELEGADLDYVDRFKELASREFESEAEVDGALNEVLNDIEQEFFFGALKRGWKKFRKSGVGKLVSKAVSQAAGNLPAFQALKGVTSLARGDVKGLISSMAKAGLGSVVPGGGVALDALRTLGFAGYGSERETSDDDREAWNNVVEVAREAYEHLAANLNEQVDQPLEASRLAGDAFKAGLAKVTQAASRSFAPTGVRGHGHRRHRRIHLRRGDILVIECE